MCKMRLFLWFSMVIWLLVACEGVELVNPIPEIRNVTGPAGELNDYDHKESTAEVDVKDLFDVEIYFRYVENDESKLRSIESIEIQPFCSTMGTVSNCSITFPNAYNSENQATIFEVGTVAFYQWFIEYRLPEGDDIATVESPMESFSIVSSQLCTSDAQCTGERLCGPGIQMGSAVGRMCAAPPCPFSANGLLCSSHGRCDWETGQCGCDAEYSTAPDCSIVCQRCYGAAGNNCGAAENGLGFCAFIDPTYSLPFGMTMEEACISGDPPPMLRCDISVGSWTHDECCIRDGEFATCTVGIGNVCEAEGNLALSEFSEVLIGRPRVWSRIVDPCAPVCGVHGPNAPSVDFDAMCNPSGGTLSCTNAVGAAAYCCSGSATTTDTPGLCQCE